MEITGRIKVVGETKEFGANGFQKRELVVTTSEQYPQHILIEFTQDKCGLLDSCQLGQDVKVSINIRGREWVNPEGEAKYFNSINGWRIEAVAPAVAQTQQAPPVEQSTPAPTNTNEPDDLPF